MFLLKSGDIFRSDTRSPVLSSKSFDFAAFDRSHGCFSLVPPTAVRNDENILNCSIRCSSVRSSNSNVDRVSKPVYPIVSSYKSGTNTSKSHKFTPSNSHSVDSSTSSSRVVSHHNIHRKRKLRKNVISLSFVKSTNDDDISNTFIVGRDKINVLTTPGKYYKSSVFFYQHFLGVLNIRDFY